MRSTGTAPRTRAAILARMSGACGQRGSVLLVALILLALITLHALASWSTGSTQLRVAGSVQARHEAQVAAQAALAGVLSGEAFLDDPAGVAAQPMAVDIDGDGIADYAVRLVITCDEARPVAPDALDPLQPADAACANGAAFGAASFCTDTLWNLRSAASTAAGTAATGAAVEVNQGVRVRVDAAQARNSC